MSTSNNVNNTVVLGTIVELTVATMKKLESKDSSSEITDDVLTKLIASRIKQCLTARKL